MGFWNRLNELCEQRDKEEAGPEKRSVCSDVDVYIYMTGGQPPWLP